MTEAFSHLSSELLRLGAPAIANVFATAIGGPAGVVAGGLASKAIEMLAKELDVPANAQDVLQAVTKKDLEKEHGIFIQHLDKEIQAVFSILEAETEALKVEVKSAQDARLHQQFLIENSDSNSMVPAALTAIIIVAFVATIAAMFVIAVPENNLAMMLFGQLSAFAGAAVQFWLGSSKSSRDKDQTVKNLSKG
jgi:hypothetical protein